MMGQEGVAPVLECALPLPELPPPQPFQHPQASQPQSRDYTVLTPQPLNQAGKQLAMPTFSLELLEF